MTEPSLFLGISLSASQCAQDRPLITAFHAIRKGRPSRMLPCHFPPAQLRVPNARRGQIQLPVARPVVDEPEVDEQVGHGAPILLAIVYIGRKWPFASRGGRATW